MAARTAALRALAAGLPALLAGCFDEPPLPESGVPIFGDSFAVGLTPNAFQGSLLTSLKVDGTKAYAGTSSIKLEIPASASGFSGGAVLADSPRDLSGTNALVFWATASRAATFDKVGFGLNFDPFPSTYQVTLSDLPLTASWVRHRVPIPDPSRLAADRGMLWWAEADPTAYTAWLDEVKFDVVDAASMAAQPTIAAAARTILVGGKVQVGGVRVAYTDFDGTRRAVEAPGYFQFASSNTAVATVGPTGEITGVGLGQATVTARVGPTPASGAVTVDVVASLPTAPATAPPAPTLPQADVISLLAKPYASVPVDKWRADWSSAVLTDVTIGGDPMKKYSSLDFVGIEFIGTPPGSREIDASGMTHFHVDVWTPDATAFRVKLVDAGADAAVGTADDSEHELVLDAASTPALGTLAWVSLDLPLASFANLKARAHLAQLIFSALPSGVATVYVDNVYFHK